MTVFIGVKEKDEEFLRSERPALEQLHAMGYEYKPQAELNQERKDYRQVLLYNRLKDAIIRHNPDLDEDGIYDAIRQIHEDFFPHSLDQMDTNENIRAKLVALSRSGGLDPITVTQNFGEGNIEKTVNLFDFDRPENNNFLVTNQFRLDGLKEPVYPDIVIFVNGIPLVIIECKSPDIADPIQQAVEKNFARYQSRGNGYERLMFYNHFLIATCGHLARHGTIGSSVNHYGRWSEAYPYTIEEIRKLCKIGEPREQEILIAGMLSKTHLLDLLKNYVIYEVEGSKKVKKLAKHQQYRLVTKALNRLAAGTEKITDKGGVVWHTQGSGKSLSMLWFTTQLRNKFGNPPILIITDRRQLDDQIHRRFIECGFDEPEHANSIKDLAALIRNPKGKTIITTLQKFNDRGNNLNTTEKIIVLVDEAHRTQYGFNAEDMRAAMPNAVFFAFTGTPIDKKNRSTYRVFGPLLDKYSFEESKADGATLPIFYEGRMPELFVEGVESVDQIFDRIFSSLDEESKRKLKKQYVTKEKISEVPARIRKICIDLIDHFGQRIQPNGFKAMLVVTSREAAVTYKKELDKLNAPASRIIMTSNLGETGSDGTNWDEYYLTPLDRERLSERFKTTEDPTQIIIVVDMLLVGYDVPIVQALYLDKGLREHSLLQAIARVNRPFNKAKDHGLIVDYCGITKELQKALAIFDEDDIQGALEPIDKLVRELSLRHAETMIFFENIDKNDDDDSSLILKFEPINVRDDFEYAFKMFSKALEALMPRKEADPYVKDFLYVSKIRMRLRNRFGGVRSSLRLEGKKIQQLIDDHVRSTNISQLMERREITTETFLSDIAKLRNEKARTAIIKNKARQIITENIQHNPIYYEKLRERLEKIIQEEKTGREKDADYFNRYKEVIERAAAEGNERKDLGLANQFEFAVYEQLFALTEDKKWSIRITKKISGQISVETRIVGWQTKTSSDKKMRVAIYDILASLRKESKNNKLLENQINDITQKIVALAKINLKKNE